MSIITDYIAWANSIQFEDLPQRVVEIGKTSMIDTIGVIHYGLGAPAAKTVQGYINECGGAANTVALGYDRLISMPQAALWNGFCGHVDDFDECSLPGHSAVVVLPAALAAAGQKDVSGRDLLRAYCLGLELMFKIAKVAANDMISVGWHTTSAIGVLGAAAAVSIILGLDDTAFANALGIAASKAGGLVVNFGTGTKPYQVAAAAAGGVEAALLACHRLTADAEALEGKDGYFSTFLHKTLDASLFAWGPWELEENGMLFKKYPSCLGSHSSIDALYRILKEHPMKLEEVESLRIGLSPYSFACMQYVLPQTVLESKFSVSFPLCRVLQAGELRVHDFCEEVVLDPQLQTYMARVTTYIPAALQAQYVHPNGPCLVEVTCTDGRVFKEPGELHWSTPSCWNNLISKEELYQKFIDCTRDVLMADNVEDIFGRLWAVEKESNVKEFIEQIQNSKKD